MRFVRDLFLAGLLAPAALAAPAFAGDRLSPTDRKAMETLDGLEETDHLVLHYDPRELSKKEIAAARKLNEGFYVEVEKALGLEPPRPVHVFLYRDSKQMQEISGRSGGVAAFALGDAVHAPFDYDDCHEFVHIFAQHLPRDAESVETEGFFVEGLATAVQSQDEGVPMSTWAAVYARYGRAPSLVSLRRSWPEGASSGVHPYHLTGSFHDFLIRTHGMKKVLWYYTHCLEAHEAFGKSFARLESEWRTWLAEREIPEDHEKQVLAKMGINSSDLLPTALRERKGTPLFDGKSLKGWHPERKGVWSVRDGLLVGTTADSWARLTTLKDRKAVHGLRVRFRMVGGDAFQMRIHETDTGANETVLAAWATFLTQGRGGTVYVNSPWKFVRSTWHEAVFTVRDGVGSLYVDGVRTATGTGARAGEEGKLGIGIEKGTVEISSVEALSDD